MPTACDSCGRDEPELEAVHRVYVLAEGWRDVSEAVAEENVRVVAEVEHWCFACRAQYPHRPAG